MKIGMLHSRRAGTSALVENPNAYAHFLATYVPDAVRQFLASSVTALAVLSFAVSVRAQDSPFGELTTAPTAAGDALAEVGSELRPPASGSSLSTRTDSPQIAHDSAEVAAALSKTGSIVFRETPLAEVILILSDQWGINIVAGAEISGTISGTYRDETLEKILDSLLTANGYHYRQIGNSLVILSASDNQSGKPTFRVEVIDTAVSDTQDLDELIEALKLLMSPEGQILPVRSSGKLAIHDTPEKIAEVKQLLQSIVGEQPPTLVSAAPSLAQSEPVVASPADTFVGSGALELRPQFILATDLQTPLEMLLGEGVISIVAGENLVVVIGDEAVQRKARALMMQLDRPRAQVRITGYIYDVDLGEIESLGVDWNQQFMSQAIGPNGVPRNLGLSQGGLLTPNAPSNAAQIVTGLAEDAAGAAAGAAGGVAGAATGAAAGGASGGQFLFRTLNSHFELQALIQALDQTDGSRLLADPHVTVVDRHTASLGIVTQIPIQQLTQTQQGGAIGTTTFQEAGITLDVTPRIASDGTIEMEVTPEFSVLSGFQDGNPIIDTRRASTVVRVNHGQALVIGGLRSKSTVETVRGIPGLMNVKWLGALFRMHNTDVRESEMIVLIMPEIIGYCGVGLEREMHALDVTRQQLSQIQTATNGPCTPDCRDKHCPHHNPRPRIHNGMHDMGLIGGYDAVFVDPMETSGYPSPAYPSPVFTNPSLVPQVVAPAPMPAQNVIQVPLTMGVAPSAEELAQQSQRETRRSSRRIAAKPASYRR